MSTEPREPFVAERAKVHDSVVLGPGTMVWDFSTLHMGVVLGVNVGIGEHVYVGRYAKIGNGTRISQGSHITDRMTIGENCFFGPHVVTCNDRYPKAHNPNYKVEPPIAEDEVSVGAGAVILPGVRLGRGCRIGAGAVVTRDVPPYTTVVGNPAKPIKRAAAETGAKGNS